MSKVNWTDEKLDYAVECLEQSESISEALYDFNNVYKTNVSADSLRKALQANDLYSPTHYLGTKLVQEDTNDNSEIFKVIKSLKTRHIGFGELCDILDVSPKRCNDILDSARNKGYAIQTYGDNLGLGKNIGEPEVIHIPHINVDRNAPPLFAAISDTHFGSNECAAPELQSFIDYAVSMGVKDFVHAGDIHDGCYHRGHQFGLTKAGFDKQSDMALEMFRQIPGVRWHLICGNHDMNGFFKPIGLEPGLALENKARARGREDIIYHGPNKGKISFGDPEMPIKVELVHPEKVGAFTKSYHIQLWIERGYQGGDKPHICVMGHQHVYSVFKTRNVQALQPGCFQWQTPYMQSKGLAPEVGGALVWAYLDGLSFQFKHEFIQYWPKEMDWRPVE